MVWELLAIWAIVIVTVTWFVRDEKRQEAEAAIARAARYYAHAPKYRHIPAGPSGGAIAAPMRRTGGLSPQQRAFFKALQR